MISEQPILSICIPTYNRASLLKKTLDSIVIQKRFLDTEDVEIIISDNCSEDNTGELSLQYVHMFKNKIFYYKNQSNIEDKNFGKVLSYGRGSYLKLNNDTLTHVDGSLNSIINTINQNIDQKPILFFLNGWVNLPKEIKCRDFNSFMNAVSGYITFVGFFGVWKSYFDKFNDIYFNRRASLKLPHVDYLFGTLDDDKVQAIQWAQNQSKQKVATSGGRESKFICALESGALLDGWMMGAG